MVKIDVITYLSGYEYFIFERFVGSLYDTGFNGNLYIICNNNDITKINKLQQKFNNIFYTIDTLKVPNRPHLRRFILFEMLLNKMENNDIKKPEYILICDGRDVLFQKNIENYEYKHNLYFAEEKINFMNDPKYNCSWLHFLENIFNEKFFDNIKHNKVLCSGTIIGNLISIKKYVFLMCNIINKYNWDNFHGDQGIHNYLYYTNKYNGYIDNIKIIQNKDSLFNTIGASLSLNLPHLSSFYIENNLIYDNTNNTKNISYIVHQWDRLNEEDRKKISKKYNFIITR